MSPVLLFVLIALGLLFWGLSRAAILFEIVIADGAVKSVRGRMPARLKRDLNDIVERNRPPRGTVRARVRDGAPYLVFSGDIGEATAQQMRNVVGQFTLRQIQSENRY